MHKRFVGNIISRTLLIISFIMLVPLGWAVHDDIHSQETFAFLLTISFGAILSALFILIFRIKKSDTRHINAKDGLAIVGLSWICLSAFGALPLYLSHSTATYTDAFFEIASGFTTTGATIFKDIESLPRGVLFWRCLTQWLGGMGIIVLYIALLPALGVNATQLFKAESPGLSVEKAEPRIKETAKHLWTIYFVFSFLETVLLYVGGMSFFDALCHTFTTMSTGGFSTRNASIGAFSPYIQWVIIVFMFLAGINFVLHYQLFKGRHKYIYWNEEFRTYLLMIVFLIPVFAVILSESGLSATPFRAAAFQIVSILTTTGFTTANFDLWPDLLKFSLVILMFIGGCGGSTAGGMKIMRVILSVKIALRSGMQSLFPNIVMPIKYSGRPVSEKIVFAVLSYFVIFIFLFLFGTFLFIITESCDLITAFTAAISALSNIGPGLARVGAIENYAWISIPGKWILSCLMLAGRLELYSILILFLPATWKK